MKAKVTSLFEGGRSAMPQRYFDFANWTPFDETCVEPDKRTRFDRIKRGIQLYVAGSSMAMVSAAAQMKSGGFMRIFQRCGIVKDDGRIVGWEALVKEAILQPSQREAPRDPLQAPTSGYSGMFEKLLREHSKIEDGLESYLNGFGSNAVRVNKVAFRALHRKFKDLCREEGLADDDYPLCTRSCARKALRNWFRTCYLTRFSQRFTKLQHGDDAAGVAGYGEGDGKAQRPLSPYRRWQLDATLVDLLARYEFPNRSGDWEELELPRFIQLRIIDVESGASLASRQVYSAQVMADDVSLLIWDALNGPPPVPKAVDGLGPVEGAGYPACVLSKLRFACCDVLELDNALAHLANQVQQIALSLMGARVVLGPPRTPRERAAQESKFRLQARRVLHQLPGTTGSHPRDPVRKRAAVPLEGRVHASEIDHVLDVYVQNENALPTAASGYIASLQRLQRQLEAGVLQPKYLAEDKRFAYFFSSALRVTVKCDPKTGRRPYLNYLYAQYSSKELGQRFDLTGKHLWLRPDPRDLRTVMLFNEDGTVFGEVRPLGRWGTFPHDARMRRIFGVLKRQAEDGERADDHPIAMIFAQLRPKAADNRKAALQLTYIVEYFKRMGVALDDTVHPLVDEWSQLQSAVRTAAELPQDLPAANEPGPAQDAECEPRAKSAPRPARLPQSRQPAFPPPAGHVVPLPRSRSGFAPRRNVHL